MKVVFVTAAWRRYDVTRLALAQRRHLCGELAGRGHEATCVVVADDENLDIAAECGFHTVEQNNDMLGRKFNDGIEYALETLAADYVVPIGSDDWMHIDLFNRLPDPAPAMPEPTDDQPVVVWSGAPEATTGRVISFVNLHTGTLAHCTSQSRSGVIPWVLPRQLFERCGGRPIVELQNIGIDFSLVVGLGVQPAWVWADPHPLARVDFKSDVNLNSYRHVTGALEHVEHPNGFDLLEECYPVDLVDLARAAHLDLAGVAA